MPKKQYLFILFLALVFGLMGGFILSHIIQPVFAEKESKPQKVIVAEEFRLVDKNGVKLAALFSAKEKGPVFILGSTNSGEQVCLTPTAIQVSDLADESGFMASAGGILIKESGSLIVALISDDGPSIFMEKEVIWKAP